MKDPVLAASHHAQAAPTWFWWVLAACGCCMAACVFVVAWLDGAFDLAISALRQRREAKADHAWLHAPYAGPNACYGCGLEPEVMLPGRWILCFWCNELREILMNPRTANQLGQSPEIREPSQNRTQPTTSKGTPQ